ncbi:MAG: phospho-N-acetylmuramoyl-pentapeptide-transferase, partial [Deltaproteobacteria bacterium]|nr:phospho-N-acetylmuramoyl-pentapeptide-transferase [Deltaproteobacteria bacterium]
MLYHLLYPLSSTLILFNVFRYITFRAIMATLTALMISFLLGRPLVDYLRAFQIGQMIRDDGPQSHLEKGGTPTMGGVLILFAMTLSCLLWTRLDNIYFWLVLGVTVCYGAIGFTDDYLKIVRHSHKGLTGKQKLALQLGIGALVGLFLWLDPSFKTTLAVPFFKKVNPDLGIFYVVFAALVIA